jgi:Ca2+/Na+ antiporter
MFSTWAAFNYHNNPKLAFGEVIGSTILISLTTVGLIALSNPFKISGGIFLRDSLFLLFTLWIFGIFLIDSKLELWEGFFMTLFYVGYVFLSSLFSLCGESSSDNRPLSIANDYSAVTSTESNNNSPEDDLISITNLPSAAPSSASLFEDESLDLSYFQPDLHFRHSFPTSREILQRRLSHSSWHRRSYYEAQQDQPEQEPDLDDEDYLQFQPTSSDFIDTLKLEFQTWLPFIWPIQNTWPKLSFSEKMVAFIQAPFIAIVMLTCPVVEEIHIQVSKDDYIPLPIEPELIVEDQVEMSRLHYPLSLLSTQVFFAPILWVCLILHGLIIFFDS